jgi:electron transport complex protein RnfG
MVKMVIVLTILCSLSGGLLAAVKSGTEERIEGQVLKFVKGPAIEKIMEGAENNPIADRFSLMVGDKEVTFFVGVYNGDPSVVAFETKAGGYGGDMGVMVAVNVETGEIHGVDVTTHYETPGVGSLVETDQDFKEQFKGVEIGSNPTVGEDIQAMSGATITSKAVATAVRKAEGLYAEVKPQLKQKISSTVSG